MKSIKAPVFEGRNRSPNPSFGSLPLVLLLSLRHASRAPRLFHPRVSVGETRVAHTMEGAGMGEKGGIQSPFSTDERGNRPTPFFSLSPFLFSSSSFLILLVLCIICFFLRPLSLPRILLVKRRVPHRRMKKYILIHLMQFLFALCFFVEDFEVSSSSWLSPVCIPSMMRDVSLIYYVSFRFSTFLFPFSRLPPFPSFFRSLIFVPFFPPQLRPNLSSLSSNSWHSPRRLRVLHRYILASSFFFILISYSPRFCKRIGPPFFIIIFLSSSRLSFPYHATTSRATSPFPSLPSTSIKRHSSSYLIISLSRLPSPLLFIVPSPFAIFPRIFLRRHRSVIHFPRFFLSLSLSQRWNTVDPRAVNIRPVVYDPHPVRGSPRTGLNSCKTQHSRVFVYFVTLNTRDNVSGVEGVEMEQTNKTNKLSIAAANCATRELLRIKNRQALFSSRVTVRGHATRLARDGASRVSFTTVFRRWGARTLLHVYISHRGSAARWMKVRLSPTVAHHGW